MTYWSKLHYCCYHLTFPVLIYNLTFGICFSNRFQPSPGKHTFPLSPQKRENIKSSRQIQVLHHTVNLPAGFHTKACKHRLQGLTRHPQQTQYPNLKSPVMEAEGWTQERRNVHMAAPCQSMFSIFSFHHNRPWGCHMHVTYSRVCYLASLWLLLQKVTYMPGSKKVCFKYQIALETYFGRLNKALKLTCPFSCWILLLVFWPSPLQMLTLHSSISCPQWLCIIS